LTDRETMKKSFFLFLLLLGFCSCKSSLISKSDLQENYSRREIPEFESRRETRNKKDSALFIHHHPDTLFCKDAKGQMRKIKLTEDQRIEVSYGDPKAFWQRGLRANLRHDQVFIIKDTLVSTTPIHSGLLQKQRGYAIPMRQVSGIKIRNIANLDNSLSLEIPPLSLIDVYGGFSYRIGAEMKLYRNMALYVEAGKYFSYSASGNESRLRGSILLPEIKYYLNDKGNSTGRYFALQYVYKDQTDNWSDTVTTQQPSGPVRVLRNYDIVKIINSINIQYGCFLIRNKRLTLDYFVGFGMDFRNAHNTLSLAEQNSIVASGDHSLLDFRKEVGKQVLPAITFGIRIGFHLK
jgi:hypothetical protein